MTIDVRRPTRSDRARVRHEDRALPEQPLGEVVESQLRFPLAVRLPDYVRHSPQDIAALTLTTPGGERELGGVRVTCIGRSGEITAIRRGIGAETRNQPPDDRGQRALHPGDNDIAERHG